MGQQEHERHGAEDPEIVNYNMYKTVSLSTVVLPRYTILHITIYNFTYHDISPVTI